MLNSLLSSLVIILITITTIIVSVQGCLDSGQIQGQCTACSNNNSNVNKSNNSNNGVGIKDQQFVDGYCYKAIIRCIDYTIGPICNKCQSGYILVNNQCVKQQTSQGNNAPTPIAPNNIGQLTIQQIRNQQKLNTTTNNPNNNNTTTNNTNNKYGQDFILTHSYFVRQHQFLSIYNIRQVANLTTITGRYISIHYQQQSAANNNIQNNNNNNNNQHQYIGSVFISNKYNTIQQPYFTPQITRYNNPLQLVQLLYNNYQLDGYQIYQIQIARIQQYILIDMINRLAPTSNILRHKIYKQNIINNNNNITVKQQQLSHQDLILQQIFKIHPEYQGETIRYANKNNGCHIYYFGEYISISGTYNLIVNGSQLIIFNQPILTYNVSNSNNINNKYYELNDLTLVSYLQVQQYIRNQYRQQLTNTRVIQVLYEVNNGIRYRITFQAINSNNNTIYRYQIIVHRTSQKIITIQQANKLTTTNQMISSLLYNYNDDNLFFIVYPQIIKFNKIVNNISISRVIRKRRIQLEVDVIQYTVLFSQNNSNSNNSNSNSDSINNKYLQIKVIGNQANLQGYCIDNIKIIGATQTIVIKRDNDDNNNKQQPEVSIKQPQQILQAQKKLPQQSQQLKQPQLPKLQKQQQIQNMTTPEPKIQQSQCEKINYPIYILIHNNDTKLDSILLRTRIQNIIRESNVVWYTATLQILLESQNIIKAYINNGSIVQITLSRKSLEIQQIKILQGSTNIFGNNYLALQFPIQNFIIPKSPKTNLNQLNLVNNIARASNQIRTKQVANPTLIVAARIAITRYRFIVTTDLSPKDPTSQYYIKFNVFISSNGLAAFYGIEKIFTKDFSVPTCLEYSTDQLCLSCNTETQISAYGKCFKKLYNCAIQLLDSCVHCQPGYHIKEYICIKNCGN